MLFLWNINDRVSEYLCRSIVCESKGDKYIIVLQVFVWNVYFKKYIYKYNML